MHLLPAKAAPFVTVFRRKPTNWWHVLRWNTATDQVEHGSWFRGTLYPKRADVSFEGDYLVFLAMAPAPETWNRVSRPPLLSPMIEGPANGTYHGGGYWATESLLRLNGWRGPFMRSRFKLTQGAVPLVVEYYEEHTGDLGVLYPRLRRDGWARCGDNWGWEERLKGSEIDTTRVGDDGWKIQPSDHHPTLRMTRTGHVRGTDQFKFWLEEFPKLIPAKADWACWDCLGQLLFSCEGVLYKYGLNDIAAGTPKTVLDLEHLTPPPI